MRYLIGLVRCLACGAESVSAWPLQIDALEQECPECESISAIPVRAQALEDWPEVAAIVELGNIRAQQVRSARDREES